MAVKLHVIKREPVEVSITNRQTINLKNGELFIRATDSDYDNLENKPSINNVELSGNKTSSELNLQDVLVSGENIKTINGESVLGSGDISISGTGGSWDSISNKPFSSIDTSTLKVQNDILYVNTTDDAEEDNTRPITSSGVNVIVGNINVLLEQI